MSKSAKRRLKSDQAQTPKLKMRPIAAACSGLLLFAGASYAQEATPPAAPGAEQIETVVVTGIRHSIESSVATKRDADSIVESISAEDIGKLPDISIAESLARMPGVAAQRVDGRAQVLSIRGLGPKYGVTLLNGREIVSTGDNRSVEYDQFPSELINAATLYKTPDASLSAIGLSGTLNMKTVRPLNFKGPQINANVRGEWNSNGELIDGSGNLGNRVSASYINQFNNNTLGLAIGFAHLDSTTQEKYNKSWWWADTTQWGQTYPGIPAGNTVLQGFEAGVTSTNQKRDGLMAVLEFKPNKDFHSLIDMYYSKFDQKKSQVEVQGDTSAWSGTTWTNPVYTTIGGSSVVTGGTLTTANADTIKILNRYSTRQDDIFAIGWNNELKLDKWTLGADLSYSKAKRDEMVGELTAQPTTPFSMDINVATASSPNQFSSPSIDLSNPSTVLLTHEWGRGGRAQYPKVEDDMSALKLTAKRDLEGPLASIEGGLNYSDRTKDMQRSEVYYNLNGGGPTSVASNLLHPAASFAGFPAVLAWDFNGVLDAYYTATPFDPEGQTPGRYWDVQEKVTTAFGKLNLDFEGKVPVRGNLGVQVVRADQQSSGLSWNGDTTVPVSAGKTYTDVLPSLNLNFDMGEVLSRNTYVRLGAAKEMARPNMEDMRASFSAGLSADAIQADPLHPTYHWSGNGGNPNLEPWRATALDLSIEKYLGKRSYVSAALFRKNVESSVYNQDFLADYSGVPIPAGALPPGATLGTVYGNLTVPMNGHGGHIKGVEFSASLDFGLIAPQLDGFGFTGSLSNTTSNLHEENNTSKKLDGLSGVVRNLSAYYEKYGYSARISQRYRSKFQSTTRNQFNDNVFSAIGAETIVDLQLGYAVEKGPMKGLSVLFQVNNLTDEPYTTSVGSATNGSLLLPEKYNTYGKQYLLGVTYKM